MITPIPQMPWFTMTQLGTVIREKDLLAQGIPPGIAKNIDKWFSDPVNRDKLLRLEKAGVKLFKESAYPEFDNILREHIQEYRQKGKPVYKWEETSK